MGIPLDELEDTGRPRWLVRLSAGLNRGGGQCPIRAISTPVVIAQELLAWCHDDGRWNPRATKDWCSLLDDVDAAWSRLGPRLTDACDVETQLAVLREVRAYSASLIENRPTVEDAAHVLGTAFDGPSALFAAVDDLFEVAKRNTNPGSLDDETNWHLGVDPV
jgi:hypothetical protein